MAASNAGVNYFESLPDEVVLHIFSFLYGNYKNENKLIEVLLNTFGSKNIANLPQVDKRFKCLAGDQYPLLLNTKNKEVFQGELFRICKTKNPSEQDLKILYCLLKASILNSETLDINAKDELGGTPLMLAVLGSCKTVELILNYVARFDLDKQLAIINVENDIFGFTPLLLALFWDKLEVV